MATLHRIVKKRRGVGFLKRSPETPKLARIRAIKPYYSNGQLLFLDTWNQDYPELVEQLIHYSLAAHDDGPDALAGAIALILANEKARRQVLIPRAR